MQQRPSRQRLSSNALVAGRNSGFTLNPPMRESRVWGLNSAAPSAHIPEIYYVIHSPF
jgi:hypothetical protein